MASQLYSDSHQQKALRKINHTKVYTYIDDAPNWLLFFVYGHNSTIYHVPREQNYTNRQSSKVTKPKK